MFGQTHRSCRRTQEALERRLDAAQLRLERATKRAEAAELAYASLIQRLQTRAKRGKSEITAENAK